MIDASRNWDSHAIKAEIHRRGLTLTDLALEAGLDPSACRVALIRPYPRADQAIAQFLGLPLNKLWPCRYDAQGNRISRRQHHTPRGREKQNTRRRPQ